MTKVFYVKWFDKNVGTISLPDYVFSIDSTYDSVLPNGLHNYDGSPLDPNGVRRFLESRVPKEKNKSVRRMISKVNYSDNDLIHILEETYGMKLNDFIWIVNEENVNLEFADCHVSLNQSMWAKILNLYND